MGVKNVTNGRTNGRTNKAFLGVGFVPPLIDLELITCDRLVASGQFNLIHQWQFHLGLRISAALKTDEWFFYFFTWFPLLAGSPGLLFFFVLRCHESHSLLSPIASRCLCQKECCRSRSSFSRKTVLSRGANCFQGSSRGYLGLIEISREPHLVLNKLGL